MKIFALLTVFATSIGTLSVEAEDHGEGAPPHWEPVDNARQALHDELGELVENGDLDRIHELIGQLEESFHAAVDAEIQHQHEGQERHRAIDEQFHQEHEEPIEPRMRRTEPLTRHVNISTKNLRNAGIRHI